MTSQNVNDAGYQGPERRHEVHISDTQIERIAERAAEHAITKLGIAVDSIHATEAAVNKLVQGFPAGDVDGHRRYHEAVIEWRELRNKLVREALVKMAGAGAVTAAGFTLLAIWKAVITTIRQ